MKKLSLYILTSTFILASCGGGSGSNSSPSPVTNTAPQLAGLTDLSIDENTTAVTIVQANDAERDAISYSIDGEDSGLFSMGSISGELVFNSPPDYENPQDANADNIYTVNIIASDGTLSSSLGIMINVVNLGDMPVVFPLPVSRTTQQITLAEEDSIDFETNTLELDFYRNPAYRCGFSGNYTFLVVDPANNAGAEAPLWVFLHGGGAGYFDEQQSYKIGVTPNASATPSDPNNHNTEKTLERLRDDQLLYRTTKNGQIINSTISRRIMEGYRILIVSMCDHDLHSGMGTPYLNNPDGGEVNGLQANMAAIDYTVANYPTTHVFAHGASAGSIGAFSLAYSYNFERVFLSGIVMDSHLASYRTETMIDSLKGVSGFVFPADFQVREASEKVGYFASPDHFLGIETEAADVSHIPILDIYGNLDPGCGGGLEQISEARAAGLDNCAWVHDGFRQFVESQANPLHRVRRAQGFGHVPTHKNGAASDFVDEFIGEILSMNPDHPFNQ
tara:strand:- start:61 stop:1575 length:1515 start_codon:yes stop_codon:yes gene_type:complete